MFSRNRWCQDASDEYGDRPLMWVRSHLVGAVTDVCTRARRIGDLERRAEVCVRIAVSTLPTIHSVSLTRSSFTPPFDVHGLQLSREQRCKSIEHDSRTRTDRPAKAVHGNRTRQASNEVNGDGRSSPVHLHAGDSLGTSCIEFWRIRVTTHFRPVLVGGLLMCLLLGSTATNAADVLRTLWRGQWVNYTERGDHAVVEGDIIIGGKDQIRAATLAVEAALADPGRDDGKALVVDSDLGLWKRAASGIVEVPYVIEAGNSTTIAAAITEINRLLQGTLQWVPRGAQVDYVAFNIATPNAGFCASALGRTGGRQTVIGDPVCDVGVLIHELGHAMGLLHVQADVNTVPFIDVRLNRIPPNWRSQSDQQFFSRTLNGYDYASIMHYGRTGFVAYADPINTETKPPGIDIGYPATYSTSDVDALKRLYGSAPLTPPSSPTPRASTWWLMASPRRRRSPSAGRLVACIAYGHLRDCKA